MSIYKKTGIAIWILGGIQSIKIAGAMGDIQNVLRGYMSEGFDLKTFLVCVAITFALGLIFWGIGSIVEKLEIRPYFVESNPGEGGWICSKCNARNASKSHFCSKCGSDKY